MCVSRLSIAFAAIVIATIAESRASEWNVQTGNWSNESNWSDGVPVWGSLAVIGNGGTATINQDDEGYGGLRVIYGSAVEMTGGTLHAAQSGYDLAESDATGGGEWVGFCSTGSFRQTGGTNTIDQGSFFRPIPDLGVGFALDGDSATGSYELSGSGSLTAGTEGIGWNLSSTVPGSANGHFIHTGGTNECRDIILGGTDLGPEAATGVYDLSGTGQLTAMCEYIGMGGSGTFNQSGGTNTVTSQLLLSLVPPYSPFHVTAGVGQYNLSGGQLSAATEELWGHFTHSGGTNASINWIQVGDVYELSGTGEIQTCSEFVIGRLTQTAGTNTFGELYIGTENAEGGIYNLTAGTLVVNREKAAYISKCVLAIGSDTSTLTHANFNLGDVNSTGSISEIGTGPGCDLEVWSYSPEAAGCLRGWGVVGLTGILTNNGQIVAKGYGTDRTLNLSSFTSVTNTLTGISGNGWFAEDHGRLTLPSIAVVAGTGSYNWGEAAGTSAIGLVNSVRMSFANVGADGALAIDLLAPDRTDVPQATGISLVGVWDFNPPEGFAFSSVDLTFRYDDTLAASLGIGEDTLHVYHFTNGQWVDVTSGIDTANDWIFANGITSFSLFAVGGIAVPEPSTIVLLLSLAVAGAIPLARRWRGRSTKDAEASQNALRRRAS